MPYPSPIRRWNRRANTSCSTRTPRSTDWGVFVDSGCHWLAVHPCSIDCRANRRSLICRRVFGSAPIHDGDRVNRHDVRRVIRREGPHQLPAAHGQVLLVQCVEALAALLPDKYQVGLFQLLEVMAHGRLVDLAAKFFDHFVHAQPDTAQARHNLLARVVGYGFGKLNGINLIHTRNYIDIYRYVKDQGKGSAPSDSGSLNRKAGSGLARLCLSRPAGRAVDGTCEYQKSGMADHLVIGPDAHLS